MFCKNCGNELKDTEKFCAACGTPVEMESEQPAPEQPASGDSVKANVEKVTEAASQAAESVAKKAQELGEKGKDAWQKASGEGGALSKLLSGKNRIWLIVCAAVLVLAISCTANAAKLNNFFHKTFSSPEKYFQFAAGKKIDEAADLIGEYYGTIISNRNLYDTSYSGELSLSTGEEMQRLIKFVQMFADLDDMGIDLSELNSLKVGVNMSIKDTVGSYGLTTAVNKVNLFSANVVMDMDQGEVYLQIPELTKTYLGVDLGDYIGDADELLEAQELNKELVKALPKQAEVEKLVNRYLTIALKNMDKVSIGRKNELKVGGIAQKCTELKVTINSKVMQKVAEAVLEEAQDDKKLEKIIVGVVDAAGQDGDEVYEDFMDEVEYMLDHIDDLGDDDTQIKMSVYVDNKGNIIGLDIEWKDYWDRDNSFSALTARKGSNIAYELSTVERGKKGIEISGKGKRTKDALTGDFEVKANGQSALDLQVKGLDVEKLKKGYINGKIEIALSSKLVNELGAPSAVSSLLKNSSILLDCKSSSNSVNSTVTMKYDGKKMLDATLALKSGKGSKVSIPSGKSVIMAEDWDDVVDDYLDEIDWDKFLNSLEKTKVFSELADDLEDVLDDLDDLVRFGNFLRYF